MITSRCRLLARIPWAAASHLKAARHEYQALPNVRHYHSCSISRRDHPHSEQYHSGIWADPIVSSHPSDATIFALSTAQGKAGIAIIRISGRDAVRIYRSLCPGTTAPKPRYAAVRTIHEPHTKPSPETVLDSNAMVLFFPGPASVTGEDVLELHVHGGPAIVKSILTAIPRCASVPGSVRYAEPGEFTRRGFMNDRLDLIQVEALGDSLSAMTEEQRRIAVRGTTSQLGRLYEDWRQMLLAARGELEALIDFSEDQHFDESPSELMGNVTKQVSDLRTILLSHVQNAMRGELLRNGISISLLGAPNAGKSSLLNRIVGREAAIVSHEAGTTRDVVEVSVDIGGFLCRFGDTAGLRKARRQPSVTTTEPSIGFVEQEGMRRARQLAASSDLVVVVLSIEQDGLHIDQEVVETVARLREAGRSRIHVVVNKTDLILGRLASDAEAIRDSVRGYFPDLQSPVSFITCLAQHAVSNDDGITALLGALTQHFVTMTTADDAVGHAALGATARQRALLGECVEHLGLFLENEHEHVDLVLGAEHLRNGAGCLARITGRGEAGDVEEVLGVVFEKFCVGK